MGTYNDDIKVENGNSYFKINFKYRKNLNSIEKEYEKYYHFFKYNYVKYLPKNKNARICDMACGIGESVNSLKELGYTNVIGIDFDTENIKFCKRQGLNAEKGNIYDYFKDKNEQFDVIILNDMMLGSKHRVFYV